MIFVFLNNKLIALDTVLPLMLELKRRHPNVRLEFLCFEPRTETAIRENVVLSDALDSIGRLRMVGRRKAGAAHWLGHRLRSIAMLSRIAFLALVGGARFVHFKALNEWPFRLLYVLAPNRTFFAQASNTAQTATERSVDQINKKRSYPSIVPAAGQLIGFNGDWWGFADPRLADKPHFLLPPTIQLPAWNEHLAQAAPRYLRDALSYDSAVGAGYAVYILSSMDHAPILQDPDGFPDLMEETLAALHKARPELFVLVKPHPATRPTYRERVAAIIERQVAAGQAVAETHLHPQLLASKARFFIANVFSSTFINAVLSGTPTIEFTRYSETTLAVTDNGSMRPDLVDHFINGDAERLGALVGAIQSRGEDARQPVTPRIADAVWRLLDTLAGAAPAAGHHGA